MTPNMVLICTLVFPLLFAGSCARGAFARADISSSSWFGGSRSWEIMDVNNEVGRGSAERGVLTRQTIRGIVVDRSTQGPLPGASVVVTNVDPLIGTITDHRGQFELAGLSPGRYDLEVRFLGFETIARKGVLVSSAKEVFLEFALTEQVIAGEVVVITSKLAKDQPVNEMAVVSARMFTVEETRRYAGGADDPARMASAFAGVATTGDVANNALIIRGNAPKGVLWRLEGVEIPNPNHFAGLSVSGGGAVSVFSNQLLDNSDFLTGAFPAEYGNALAGVFDMHLRRGNATKREHTFQLGLLGIDFATEGPFGKNSGASYVVNYRYSTLGLLTPLLPVDGLTTYQDLSFKTSVPIRKSGRLDFWGIGGLDLQRNDEKPDSLDWRFESDTERLRLSLGLGATGVNYRHLLGSKSYVTASAAISGNRTRFETWQAFTSKPVRQEVSFYNTKVEQLLRLVVNHKFSPRVLGQAGVSAKRRTYDINSRALLDPDQSLEQIAFGSGVSGLYSAHSQVRFETGPRVTFDAGLHAQYFALTKEFVVEPRASLQYHLSNSSSITLGYGLHSQIEDLHIYLAELPTSQLGGSPVQYPNRDLQMTKAHHFVLGYDVSLSDVSRARIEGYYQYLFDVGVVADGSLSLLNFSQDFEFRQPLVNEGAGRNVGTELTIERFLDEGYYFLVTGSVFKSTYQGGDGIWRSTRYDQRFSANVLAGREFQIARTSSVIGINARVGATGGALRSPIDLPASARRRTVVFDETKPFVDRNPAQTILDVTATYRRNRKRSSSEWALQVKNVLAQGLPYYEFEIRSGSLIEEKDVIVLPILSYKIEF